MRCLFLLCSAAAVGKSLPAASLGASSAAASLGALSAASSAAAPLREFFAALDNEGALVSVWQTAPRIWRGVAGCAELFSFADAVAGAEGGLLERACVARLDAARAGRWVAEYASPVSRAELRAALARGTVFFNGAGLDYARLAAAGALAQETLGLPVNLNVYLTEKGRDVSVAPHTDAQDVLVFQTAGRKRWRVWRPPPRSAAADPFARGKRGDDALAPAELGDPLFDAWLEPGDVLYVPIGFPHATSTRGDDGDGDDARGDGGAPPPLAAEPAAVAAADGGDDADLSCHVTLGLDT